LVLGGQRSSNRTLIAVVWCPSTTANAPGGPYPPLAAVCEWIAGSAGEFSVDVVVRALPQVEPGFVLDTLRELAAHGVLHLSSSP